ncbi:MAG TPA: hypothetical protein PLE21_00330 [Giesbergeria sp.]|nr:hypothetical protein [Giesbergeria sp.]
MALSKQALKRAIDSVPEGHDVGVWVVRVCRAVEAEVRKQDEALIRNFVAAIKLDRHDWEDWPEDSRKAFEALRARLEGKPCA